MTGQRPPDQENAELRSLVTRMLLAATLARSDSPAARAGVDLGAPARTIVAWVKEAVDLLPLDARAAELERLKHLVAETFAAVVCEVGEGCTSAVLELFPSPSTPPTTPAMGEVRAPSPQAPTRQPPPQSPTPPLPARQPTVGGTRLPSPQAPTRQPPPQSPTPPLPARQPAVGGIRLPSPQAPTHQPPPQSPTPPSPQPPADPPKIEGIRLPPLQELSREQIDILDAALGSRLLVTGPPGTGKTVMALHRAEKLRRASRASHIIVYNRVLQAYISNALTSLGLPPGSASTYHSWSYNWHRKTFNGEQAPSINGDPYAIDWISIARRMRAIPEPTAEYLFVDEGQDLPKSFYSVLDLLKPKDLTVFADENQRIHDNNSTLRDITEALFLEDDDIIHLTKNYRNTRPIAEVAAKFYVQGIDTGIPELPTRNGNRPEYRALGSLEGQGEFVARYARNNPTVEIGVIADRKSIQHQLYRIIKPQIGTIPLTMYVSGDENHRDASALKIGLPGVKLINDQSAKGTEFDTVFLIDVDRRMPRSPDESAMMMYVLCSRARTSLYFLGRSQGLPSTLARASDLINLP